MGKFVLLVLVFAVMVYGAMRLLDLRRSRTAERHSRIASPPRRIVAPDDDEDFLRELRRRRKDRDDRGESDRPNNSGG